MVSEALDGLTDEQLADLELQESGLVSGQNEGAIASTAFAQRTNPQPAPAPEPEEPVALSDYELNQLEEENYRRTDYVMTPQEFDQYWDRREKEDNEVGRFLDGLGQGAAGLIGMVPEAGRELRDGMVGMVTDPVNQAQRNIQTGAEIIRKGGINLVQLFDWVSNKVDDVATSSKRAEAINAGIRAQLQAEGRLTGDRAQDEQIYQAALAEAREAGAYKPTADQVREDRGKAYERYVREKALERDFAAVSDFKTGESQMSVPTSAEDYQITDEQPMPTISTLGSMAVDPLNALPLGAGALSKARVLRRIANLSEKPLLGAERAASGLADVAERIELGISTRLQDITGLTQKQQAALGAGLAGTAVYVDSATEGGGGLTKAVMMAGGVLPALHYGGGLLRKVGSAAGGAATIVREAGVGGLGVARAEAASNLAGNAAIPERYRKFFTGYVDGTDSTLKRVAQNADNPEALRRVSRFADRMGATQVARVADDAVSGAVTAGIVGTPFAALQPDAERAGEVMGGILTLGAAGGVAGGLARRRGAAADADIARMFADVQAVGGNVEAFARLPHATLDRLAAMQGVLAGKVDFVPLTGDEYRMNADIAQNGGEATAGVFLDRDANNRARVFINLDGKTATDAIAPHEIGHAILTSNVLDGQPRNDLRNLVNQQYGPEGVEARGREYIARMVDADLRQGVTGEAPTVLTEAEMKAVDGGKTMEDIVADRAKDPAERDRLINERMEEFRQRSIDKGEDAMDWARDEIIAETFASEAPAIDFRAIRRDAMFPRLAESMLSAGGRVLEVFGANLSSTGKLMDSPSVLFRDNPIFQDRIMQKRVREYVRSYDQYLAGLEETGAKELRGVELARSSKPEDLARSTHVKLRDEGRGVLENDFLFQKPDGTYSLKPQKIITATENARSAQIKTLYDARKFVPVNSQEFGKRKVNGREVIGGPVLPPQFDLFTNFPKHVREFARQMERSREEGGSWDIDYNAIGTGASGRYRVTNLGNVRAIQRETVPYGWIVSKANHLLAASLDLNAFRASAMKAINKGDLGLFNNDMRQVEADLKTYLANHRNGMPGEAGIGQQKRDMLNGLIGTGTAVQRTANPLYSDLNPRGSIRTWRVDRLNDAKPTGRTGYFFDYDKINNNRMPSALPQAGMAMPDVPVRGERADIPLNPRARRAAFISDRGEVRSTGRATHFETNEDLGPDFLAIGAGHLGEDGFFRFGSQTMDDAMGDSPATSAAAAARFNQSLYDQGRRPSAMLEEPPGLERAAAASPDLDAIGLKSAKFLESAVGDGMENLRQRQARRPGTGVAKNKLVRFHTNDGKPIYIGAVKKDGGKSFKGWVEETEAWLTPEQTQQFRQWYKELYGHFTKIFGDRAGEMMMAWLAAQQNVSPGGALKNVFRVEDRIAGIGTGKKGGLADAKIEGVLRDVVPEGGFGPKLSDFVDSGFQRETRTYMAGQPEGGRPFVADVHTGRDSGHVDQQTLSRLKELSDEGNLFIDGAPATVKVTKTKTVKRGEKTAVVPERIRVTPANGKSFFVDVDMRGSPGSTQYEGISVWGNSMTDYLNNTQWAGGNWTPAEVQAVGWMRTLRQYGLPESTVESALQQNTAKIFAEVNYSSGDLLPANFPALDSLAPDVQRAITTEVLPRAVDELVGIIGGSLRVQRASVGTGVYGRMRAPMMAFEVLGSPEAADLLALGLGYGSEQAATMSTVMGVGGKDSRVLVFKKADGTKFTDVEMQSIIDDAGIGGYTMEQLPGGDAGMIADATKDFTPKGLTDKRAKVALKSLLDWADKNGIEIDIRDTSARVTSYGNNWQNNKDGASYLSAIVERGGAKRIRDIVRFRGRYAEILREAYERHAPDAITATPQEQIGPIRQAAEAYLRNPKTMDIDGKKLWLVENPDDIFVSAARPPQGAATGRTRGQAMPDYYDSADTFQDHWNSLGVKNRTNIYGGKYIKPNMIVVDEVNRGAGLGTQFMEDLTRFADAKGLQIRISPTKEFGATSVNRLKSFYKRFGFVENSGRNKDYAISDTMYREPQPATASTRGQAMPDVADARKASANKRKGIVDDGYKSFEKARKESGVIVEKNPDYDPEWSPYEYIAYSQHQDVNKSASIYRRPGNKFYLEDENGDQIGMLENSLEDAKYAARLHVESDIPADNLVLLTEAQQELLQTIAMPKDMDLLDVQSTKWGSVYYKLGRRSGTDAEGQPVYDREFKVSIRDHSPSPFREKEFGRNDAFYKVPKNPSLEDVAEAVGKVEAFAFRQSRAAKK